ncbi:MAG: hypothetical protein ACR2H3_09085 [Acidimicrobiales bacterium]
MPTRWRPFSLLEQNYRGDGPPVWRVTERSRRVLDAVATMSELPSLIEVKRPEPPAEPGAARLPARA